MITEVQCPDELAQGLIDQYWVDFENGNTWNYYIQIPHYVTSDTWATKEDFIYHAKKCVDKKINILQALEILIKEEYNNYIEMAISEVED